MGPGSLWMLVSMCGWFVSAPAATLLLLLLNSSLLPATGRVDIQHVTRRNEIQACERHTLNHLLPQSHEPIQNKDHLPQLSLCHLDPRFPVQESDAFAVCACEAARHDQKDQIRGCQMQLDAHSTLLILQDFPMN